MKTVDLVLGVRNMCQVRRSNKLTGLLFQIPEQIPTHLSKRMCCLKTQRTENMIKVKAPFKDEISGLAIIQNSRWKYLHYHADKIKIHMQCSNIRYSKQWYRNYTI